MPPKPLPRGMIERGGQYQYRRRKGSRDVLIPLGTNLKTATLRISQLRAIETAERFGLEIPRMPATSSLAPEPSGPPLTVAAAAQRWLDSAVASYRNEKGVRVARARVRMYLEEFFRTDLVEELSRERLLEYRVWLGKQTFGGKALSACTVYHLLSDCRCFLRWLEETAIVVRAPIPRRFVPQPAETLPRYLSEDQVATLLERLEDPWHLVIRLGLATGLRWSEMCRAEAKHLTRDGWLEVAQSKTGKVVRVPLEANDPQLAAEIRGRVGQLVPYRPNSVGTFNRRVREKSGIPDFSHHRLRHTFATRWLAEGRSIVALQMILGHSDLKLTERYAKATQAFVLAEARKPSAQNGDGAVTKGQHGAQVVALKAGLVAS